ncbi:MAG: Hint domain-containing protein [Acetobacter malorum]
MTDVTIIEKTSTTSSVYGPLDAFHLFPIPQTTTLIKTSNGLTYNLIDTNYDGYHNYNVKITDANNNTILNQNNINSGINLLNIVKLVASGDVITGSDDSAALANLASIGTYVSIPGSTGSFVVGAGVLTANNYYIGGDTHISGLANVATGSTINVIGGTATMSGVNGASLLGALNGSIVNIEYGGTFNTGSAFASLLEGGTINFGSGGGTLILNGGGTLISLLASGTLSATTLNNYDPSKDTIELQNTTETVTHYKIENGGAFGLDSSQKVIILYGKDGKEVAEYAVKPATGVTLNNGDYTVGVGENPLKVSYSDGNTYIGVCFLADSMIETPNGEVPVQNIQVGTEVITYDAGSPQTRKVIWAGKKRAVTNPLLADDLAGFPVRILRGAISEGVPYKDMLITPEHCLIFNGQFIPARMLVNGRSVFYDKSISSYDYYHIETEQHSVIKADGMLTESYLDTGNRSSFRQNGNVVSMGASHALSWDEDAAASLTVERAVVEPIHRALAERSHSVAPDTIISAPALTEDPNIFLSTDKGQSIRKIRSSDKHVVFMLPTGVESVEIVSRASRPSDTIGPFVDDRRMLGVLIGKITLLEGNKVRELTSHLNTPELTGWHEQEASSCRWTNGKALLALGTRKPNSFAILSIEVLAAGPYIKADTANQELQTA